MGGRRPAPRVINTPTGPRRARDERDRDERRPVGDVGRSVFRGPRDRRPPGPRIPAPDTRRPRTEEKFGDSFRESRKEIRRRRRRMAGDKKDFFGRAEKPMNQGSRSSTKLRGVPGGGTADSGGRRGLPPRRPRPITIDKRNPEYEEKARKLREENDGKTISEIMRQKRKEEGGFGLPASFYQNRDQNIAKTDI